MSALPHPLTAVLDAAFDPFFLANSKGEILWQNSNAASLFGRPGSPAANLTDAFGADVAGKILRTDRAQSFEVRSKNPALETVPFACYVMDCAPGAPGSAAVLVTCKSMLPDSTRMHQHEEYLAAVAHDLKNPLGALFGYADALLDTSIGAGLKDRQREVVERIRSTASRSLEMVRNFQQLVQLDHRASPALGSAVDLNSIVKLSVEALWRGDSKQLLSMNLYAKELIVRIDRFQLERVISNLVSNAIKYTPAKGTITITTKLVDSRPALIVNNTGTVIPSNELESLFRRYTRASTGRGSPGTGLGLYIVKSILDAVGAEVAVTSTINDGTTFAIKFFR